MNEFSLEFEQCRQSSSQNYTVILGNVFEEIIQVHDYNLNEAEVLNQH